MKIMARCVVSGTRVPKVTRPRKRHLRIMMQELKDPKDVDDLAMAALFVGPRLLW
jgi:hypothetical protein